MARPILCPKYGGGKQFFGGYDGRVDILGIKLVLDSVTADTETELELVDWSYKDAVIKNETYQESKAELIFHHKASADDSNHYFDFSNSPLQCRKGIMVLTNTNCRPCIWRS